jgi:NAD(P)-dependent dehydrogenase (short-subunit alcohol dehydrogenase family)
VRLGAVQKGDYVGRLEGKIALVTGASAGIGRAVALRFAQEGARVVAVARSESVDRLTADGDGRIDTLRCDVSDPAQVAALAATCRERYGRLDVLCNNAGIGGRNSVRIHELDIEDWDRVLGTNLRGAFLVLKYTIPLLLAAGGGSIVNMASIGSFRATPGSAAYITSKGGLLLLTRTAALEYVNDNIRVNAVCPGVTRTEILANLPDEFQAMLTSRVPMGRMGTPEEVAALTLFLASDEASYVTGAAYIIDGGRGAS